MISLLVWFDHVRDSLTLYPAPETEPAGPPQVVMIAVGIKLACIYFHIPSLRNVLFVKINDSMIISDGTSLGGVRVHLCLSKMVECCGLQDSSRGKEW